MPLSVFEDSTGYGQRTDTVGSGNEGFDRARNVAPERRRQLHVSQPLELPPFSLTLLFDFGRALSEQSSKNGATLNRKSVLFSAVWQ